MELKVFVRENKHLTRGFIDFGWGNGYVCLPEGHPCFGMHYGDIHDLYEINVNGGLTFSEHSDQLQDWEEVPEGKWWVVGFDTAHSWDNLDSWLGPSSVAIEAESLRDQLQVDNLRLLTNK
jgi:hypothetical protein